MIDKSQYETAILERLIIKTGTLLALGFGEAGANIIAENMRKGDAVNPLIAGKRIHGIFGFCDIRNFTDMTEVLQEQVMLFVNDIASIVHTAGIEFDYSKFISVMALQTSNHYLHVEILEMPSFLSGKFLPRFAVYNKALRNQKF